MTKKGEKQQPSPLSNPPERLAMLKLFEAGLGLREVAKMMEVNEVQIRRQWDYDPEFEKACLAAMEDPYRSTLLHAIELAKEADVLGENEGAHKAMALVIRHREKFLDRLLKVQMATHLAEREGGLGGGPSFVLGPAAMRELVTQVDELNRKQGALEIGEAPKATPEEANQETDDD